MKPRAFAPHIKETEKYVESRGTTLKPFKSELAKNDSTQDKID